MELFTNLPTKKVTLKKVKWSREICNFPFSKFHELLFFIETDYIIKYNNYY